MPAYRFEALDASGKAQSGLVDADNSRAARSQLRAQSLVPLAVTQVVSAGTTATARVKSTHAGKSRVSTVMLVKEGGNLVASKVIVRKATVAPETIEKKTTTTTTTEEGK